MSELIDKVFQAVTVNMVKELKETRQVSLPRKVVNAGRMTGSHPSEIINKGLGVRWKL